MSEAGPRRPSQGTSGGPTVSSQAPARDGAKGIHRWKALRAWEAAALVCRLWKGSSVPLFQLANQRAPEEGRDRKRPWPHRPACATEDNSGARVDASQSKRGGGPWQMPGEVRTKRAPFGVPGEESRLAHATPIAAPLGVGDAFGLSGANPEDAVQPQHKRVGERLGAEGEVSGVRASCSRVGGHQGCSLITSRLQRSGERYPVLVGSSVRASQGATNRGERRGRVCGGVPSP